MRINRRNSSSAIYKRLGVALLLPLLAVCGCDSPNPNPSNVTNKTTVTLSQLAYNAIGTDQQIQITAASYTGTDTTPGGVTWTLTGTGCTGAGCGSLMNATSSNVTYMAPLTITGSSITVTITATSVTTPSVTASESITVTPSVFTASPTGTVTLLPNQTLNLTSLLTPNPGGFNTQFTPTCASTGNCGTITYTGISTAYGIDAIYTAPAGSAGAQTITITAVPAAAPAYSQTLTVIVPSTVGNLTFTPAILPAAIAGTAYSQSLTISGGTPPYTVSIPTATIPAWITSLTPATGNGITTYTTTVGTGTNAVTTEYTQIVTNGVIPITGMPTTTGVINTSPSTPTPVSPNNLSFSTADSTAPAAINSTNNIPLVVYAMPGTANALLAGKYVFSGLGWQDQSSTATTLRVGYIGAFTADGNGNITAGEIDTNKNSGVISGSVIGTYQAYTNQTGFLALLSPSQQFSPIVFAVTLGGLGTGTVATTGGYIEFDDTAGNNGKIGNTLLAEIRDQGLLALQSPSVENLTASPLVGSYAFAMQGRTPSAAITTSCQTLSATIIPSCGAVATAGVMTLNAGGSILTGESDATQGETSTYLIPVSGQLNNSGATDAYGRLTGAINVSNAALINWPTNYVAYAINPTTAFIMSLDPYASSSTASGFTLLEGEMQQQNLTDIAATPFSATQPFVVYGDTINSQNFYIQTGAAPVQTLGGEATALQALLTATPANPATSGSMSGSAIVELGGATGGYQAVAVPNFSYSIDASGRVTNNSTQQGLGPLSADPAPDTVNMPYLYLTDTNTGFGLGTGVSGAGIYVMQPQTSTTLNAGTYSWTNSFPNSQTAPVQAGSLTIPAGGVPASNTAVSVTGQAYQSYFSTTYDESNAAASLLFGEALTGTISQSNGVLTKLTFTQSGIQGCSGNGYVISSTQFLCFPNGTGYTSVQVFKQ